ncbi:MAG: Crp/Fnr family transcriptional regulator [Pseudomonadota bacterium]
MLDITDAAHPTDTLDPAEIGGNGRWKTSISSGPTCLAGPRLYQYLAQRDLAAPTVTVPKGRTLHMEGDPARICHVVQSGLVKTYNTLIDGRRHVLGFRSVGDMLNLTALDAPGQPRCRHTAEASTDAVLLAYPIAAIRRLLAANEAARDALRADLTRRLIETERKALNLGCLNAVARVARFLADLDAARIGSSTYGDAVPIPVCRQDIADYLGLTLETVCRSIGVLKARGIIALEGSHAFRIVGANQLKAMVGAA